MLVAVSLELDADTSDRIARHGQSIGEAMVHINQALLAAGVVGAEKIRQALIMGQLGIRQDTQHPSSGLAGSLQSWSVDASIPMVAVGVPANSPAADYAGIQEHGGVIRPKNAKALAIPLTPEAASYNSPRDMPGLTMIKRKGKPPLLVRQMARRGSVVGMEILWVLVDRVEITATHWLSRGAERFAPAMAEAFGISLGKWMESWQ